MESLANDNIIRSTERLVLVSDASTEAERLIASMRVRKVKVRDVPLMLLAGRVEAQKPMLVICDGQAPKVAHAIEKMRQGDWGSKVEFLLLGIDVNTVEAIRTIVPDIDTRLFVRPIDVYSVIQRIEEILGDSEEVIRGGSRSMASLPRVEQNSVPAPTRSVTPVPRRARSSIPQMSNRADPSSPPVTARELDSKPPPGKSNSTPPVSESGAPEPAAAAAAVVRMSEELENLLQDAERRLGQGPVSMQPVSMSTSRLTPEQELDAILPADVLSALDEPVDLDDDDETSHPFGKSERHSSMAPRNEPAAVFTMGLTNAETPVERGTGTSPNDEDTPVGRLGGRRPTTASGSEPPNAAKTGSVLTPVPASFKTHNTQSGQHSGHVAPTYGSSPTASEHTDGANWVRDFRRIHDEPRDGAHLELGGFVASSELGKVEAESVAPGTNPAIYEAEHANASDISSTTPPHPPRTRNNDALATYTPLDEEAHFRHVEPRSIADSNDTPSNKDDAQAHSTNPPQVRLSRSLQLSDREVSGAESRTRLESFTSADIRGTRPFPSDSPALTEPRPFTDVKHFAESRPLHRGESESRPIENNRQSPSVRPPNRFEDEPLTSDDTRKFTHGRAPNRFEFEPQEARGTEPTTRGPNLSLPQENAKGEAKGEGRATIEIPTALGKGDVVRALARCVRGRYSGALAIEDELGIRRVVMREGDFVMVASGIEGESLVAFLIQRGDLKADAARLTRKLPQFGRHAGAALIAHGYLRQDELWPVLRAHAEWLLGRSISVQQGAAGLEGELSARLQAEPAVFGGTTGAEVLVEIVRRIVSPEMALESLGGPKIRLAKGPSLRLLSECALLPEENQLVERAEGVAFGDVLKLAQAPDFAAAIYALVELNVLQALAPSVEQRKVSERPPARDGLDDNAVRSRVAIRRALVDEGDYFSLLGVSHEATGYEVRHAYLSLRREFEPQRLLTASTADLRDDVDLVIEVLDEAYEVLRDSARRERYRRALDAAPA